MEVLTHLFLITDVSLQETAGRARTRKTGQAHLWLWEDTAKTNKGREERRPHLVGVCVHGKDTLIFSCGTLRNLANIQEGFLLV